MNARVGIFPDECNHGKGKSDKRVLDSGCCKNAGFFLLNLRAFIAADGLEVAKIF